MTRARCALLRVAGTSIGHDAARHARGRQGRQEFLQTHDRLDGAAFLVGVRDEVEKRLAVDLCDVVTLLGLVVEQEVVELSDAIRSQRGPDRPIE